LLHFFFTRPATTEIYTLSLHDALPISCGYFLPRRGAVQVRVQRRRRAQKEIRRQETARGLCRSRGRRTQNLRSGWVARRAWCERSEEHTSELQSRRDLVCRLLLEKKKI